MDLNNLDQNRLRKESEIYIITLLGRLEYNSVEYIIEDYTYEASIPSIAVMKHYSKFNPRLLIFVPESICTLISNDPSLSMYLLKNLDELKECIKNKVRKNIIKDIDINKISIEIIPSIGAYKNNNLNIRFINTINNINYFIFCKLFNIMYNSNVKTIYVDCSIGQNIYNIILLEALRSMLVHYKLNNLLQNPDIGAKIIYSEPVTNATSANIEFAEFDVKAFFDLPIKDKDINLNNLTELPSQYKKEIYEKLNISNLKTHIGNCKLAYNAIKYNTPLLFFHNTIQRILEKSQNLKELWDGLLNILEYLEGMHRKVNNTSNDTIEVKRCYTINKDMFIRVHYQLALLNTITKFWKDNIDQNESELGYIKSKFTEIYKKLGLSLNITLLNTECENIKRLTRNLGSEPELLRKLRDPIPQDSININTDKKLREYSTKRNFFAHSRFLNDIVMVYKENDKIILRYDDREIEKKGYDLEEWIKDPEGSYK